ncbi:venom acid phosphatase Acph-1-like [Athalia rosae]|uniref:venom acid phosphatase Acph-1-like n=1 Tax=Athalia rosae TaxID=37344 RepID=UPI0020349649|nr:venom acid phosphatase Acph-1-like [Athalia rosae]
MRNFLVAICLWMVINGVVMFGDASVEDQAQLKLLAVLFRHGDRTPDPSIGEYFRTSLSPKNNWFPAGPGNLLNEGKLREYNLGRALKSRYDEFLGDIYYPAILKARSTDYDRTKMSLQLVLNGLFPPAPIQQWKKGVDWQPIPTEYFRAEEDWVLRPDLCPKSMAAKNTYVNSTEYRERLSELEDLSKCLEKATGKEYKTILDMALLYIYLSQEAASGRKLPEWTKGIFPNGRLLDAATFYFDIQTRNDELRRLSGGMLLRKITDDFKSYRNGTLEQGRKLYAYSAHDVNIAALLGTLGIWKPHMPQYSSAVIMELLEYNDEYFIKVVRYLGIPPKFIEVRIPQCDKLCPMDKFLFLMKNVIATDDDLECV